MHFPQIKNMSAAINKEVKMENTNKITERSADFDERVRAGGPFKSEEFELMTQEEFDLVLPALGPAQAREAFLTRQKRKSAAPVRRWNASSLVDWTG